MSLAQNLTRFSDESMSVEEEIKIEEDSYRDGLPRSSGDPFSSAPTKLKL